MKPLIYIIAPCSPFDREKFDQGILLLRKKGWEPVFRDDIFETRHYLAGDLKRRLSEFKDAIRHPANLIMAARGGYGFTHLMPHLWGLKPKKKKTLIGYSDMTMAFQLSRKWGWNSVHSPMLANTAFLNVASWESWSTRVLEPQAPLKIDFQTRFTTHPNWKATGELRGGCLSLLSHCQGTPWQFKIKKDTILFLEDVSEGAYQIDRLWMQLISSIDVQKIKGVIWGQMTKCPEFPKTLEIITQIHPKIRHVWGLSVGHDDLSDSIVLDRNVRIQVNSESSTLTFA